MVAVFFNNSSYFFFLLGVYSNFFFYFCYIPFIKENINSNWQKFKLFPSSSWFFFDFIIIYFLSLINFITMKSLPSLFNSYIIFLFLANIFFFFIIYLVYYMIKLDSGSNNVYFISLMCTYLGIYILFFIDNLMSFLMFLELYSVLYYYFFILSVLQKNSSVVKYKNLLLLYIWNSFLTTTFYIIACIVFFLEYYSLNFDDIIQLYDYTKINYGLYLFFFSFFWKLGLPGYQWLKLEVYSYLSNSSIFMYSIITLLVNFFLFFFITIKFLMFLIFNFYNIFYILFFFTIILIFNNLKIYNFLYFFAYSSIISLIMAIIVIYI